MDITAAKYTDSDKVVVEATIGGEKMFVPKDASNRHWQAILEWSKKDGNEIAEVD